MTDAEKQWIMMHHVNACMAMLLDDWEQQSAIESAITGAVEEAIPKGSVVVTVEQLRDVERVHDNANMPSWCCAACGANKSHYPGCWLAIAIGAE